MNKRGDRTFIFGEKKFPKSLIFAKKKKENEFLDQQRIVAVRLTSSVLFSIFLLMYIFAFSNEKISDYIKSQSTL